MANFLRTGTVFNNPNLTRLSKDMIINSNTLMVFDFGKPYCWPSQSASIVSGSEIVNLVDNGDSMLAVLTPGSTMEFKKDRKSAKFNPSISVLPTCNMRLPDSAKLGADITSGVVVCWFTHTSTIDAARPTPAVFGYCYQNTVTNQYSVEYNRAGQKYRLRMNGVLIGDVAFPNEGDVLQIAVEYQDDGNVYGYHNGQLIGSARCGATLNQPTPASIPMIGYAGGYSPGWDGELKRFWMSKNDTHGQNTARILKDYELNAARLGIK